MMIAREAKRAGIIRFSHPWTVETSNWLSKKRVYRYSWGELCTILKRKEDKLHKLKSYKSLLVADKSDSRGLFLSLKNVPQKTQQQLNKKLARLMPPSLQELDTLIGLGTVKKEIRKYISYIRIHDERDKLGIPDDPPSFHMVFLGPPGTGKTTVSRIVAKIFKELGVLRKGHLVETDRAGLIGEYVGQTAPKVDRVVRKAIDGILFIDEAYSLARDVGDKEGFGNEAIDALVKRMEDNRNRLIVIVAGYSEEMHKFLRSNPGLSSRFNRYFHFDHYTPAELLKIFQNICEKNQYNLSPDAKNLVMELFMEVSKYRSRNFGNGRFVRNFFDKVREMHSERVVRIKKRTESDLKEIRPPDIPKREDILDLIGEFI